MPKLKLSEYEERLNLLKANIVKEMTMAGYTNEYMSNFLEVCPKTFIDRKKHRPQDFTLEQIWKMERLFGTSMTKPFRRVED